MQLHSVRVDMDGHAELRLRRRRLGPDSSDVIEMTPHGDIDIVMHQQVPQGSIPPNPGSYYHLDLTPVDEVASQERHGRA